MTLVRNTEYGIRNTERGIILIFVFIVMTALTAITVGFLYMNSVQLKIGGFNVRSSEAFWLAEAGLQKYMFYLQDETYDSTNHPNLNENLGDGNYLVTSSYDGGTSTYTLTSTGTVAGLNRQIQESVIVTSAPEAYGYVVYVEGNIQTHALTTVVITGDQTDSGTNFPTVNFSYYETQAPLAQRIYSNYQFNAGTYSGTWYVAGNVSIDSGVTINGTIVSTGNISKKDTNESNIAINRVSPNPALIAGGTIDLSRVTNLTVNGLIYAGADGSNNTVGLSRSSVNITGTIIATNHLDIQRTSGTITYDGSIVSNPPPGITGGGTGGGTIARQNDWNEI